MPKLISLREIEDAFLEVMQSAFRADPAAMRAIAVNRVPCNQSLAEHPLVVVGEVPIEKHGLFELSPIGLMQGIMDAIGCERRIAFVYEKSKEPERKMLGFALIDKNDQT